MEESTKRNFPVQSAKPRVCRRRSRNDFRVGHFTIRFTIRTRREKDPFPRSQHPNHYKRVCPFLDDTLEGNLLMQRKSPNIFGIFQTR